MPQRKYLAEFWSRRPRDGDVPVWSVTVSASGQWDAHEKAAKRATRKGVQHTYATVKET